MNGALPFIAAAALLAFALGFLASRGKEMSLEQWTVGGRGFGAIFVFLLLAGEIYTTFTFLGAKSSEAMSSCLQDLRPRGCAWSLTVYLFGAVITSPSSS